MTKRYIFGAGIQGQAFFDVMMQMDLRVDGFLDNFADQETYNDVPVMKPEDLPEKDSEILISVGLISHIIQEKLIQDGFLNTLDYTQSVLKYPDILHALKTKSMWYDDDLNKRIDVDGITQFKSLLVDQKSRDLLDQIVRFRTDFKADDYIIPQLSETQYFPTDVNVFKSLEDIRFVDAGAYTGDTVKSLWEHKWDLPVRNVACFEPDLKNLARLKERVASLGINEGLFIYPAGVWSETKMLSFNSDQSSSSAISEDSGTQTIQAISLDECVYHMSPNFIKMDVEGAEIEALKGAENIIKDFTPVLAICLYHQPDHLWKIPLLIHKMNKNYKMSLRVYGDMLLETVLYCLPINKGKHL